MGLDDTTDAPDSTEPAGCAGGGGLHVQLGLCPSLPPNFEKFCQLGRDLSRHTVRIGAGGRIARRTRSSTGEGSMMNVAESGSSNLQLLGEIETRIAGQQYHEDHVEPGESVALARELEPFDSGSIPASRSALFRVPITLREYSHLVPHKVL